MSGYTDIKTKRFNNLLKKLAHISGIEISKGGRHIKVTCIKSGKSYPIPCSHNVVNKHIIKDFMKWLVSYKVCTKKEFDNMIS